MSPSASAPGEPPAFRYLSIAGGRLTALREIPFHARELELGCHRLLESAGPELVIDLSRLEYVASPQIGALIAASARAEETGRKLRILINARLVKFLERLQVDGLLGYEVVEPAADSAGAS